MIIISISPSGWIFHCCCPFCRVSLLFTIVFLFSFTHTRIIIVITIMSTWHLWRMESENWTTITAKIKRNGWMKIRAVCLPACLERADEPVRMNRCGWVSGSSVSLSFYLSISPFHSLFFFLSMYISLFIFFVCVDVLPLCSWPFRHQHSSRYPSQRRRVFSFRTTQSRIWLCGITGAEINKRKKNNSFQSIQSRENESNSRAPT